MANFFDGIDSQEVLKEKLKEKAHTHKILSFYCSADIVVKTLENGIRLTNGSNWNDLIDAKNLNSDDKIRFVKSFTYSKSENIAMWMLYGYSKNEGCLITYSGKQIENTIKKVESIDLRRINEKGQNEVLATISKKDFEIELIDVVYVGKGECEDEEKDEYKTISLKKSIYGKKDVAKENFCFDINKELYVYYAKLMVGRMKMNVDLL